MVDLIHLKTLNSLRTNKAIMSASLRSVESSFTLNR